MSVADTTSADKAADGLADLLAEHRAAELVQHTEHGAGHRLWPRPAGRPAIAATTLSATGSTSCCQAGMLVSTHSARLHAATWWSTREVGDAWSSQCSQAGDVLQPGPVAGSRGAVRLLRHDLAGEVPGQLPVDRAVMRREHPLQLPEHRLGARTWSPPARPPKICSNGVPEKGFCGVAVVAVVVGSIGGDSPYLHVTVGRQ